MDSRFRAFSVSSATLAPERLQRRTVDGSQGSPAVLTNRRRLRRFETNDSNKSAKWSAFARMGKCFDTGGSGMNEREKRDFNAGLAADVDAWLRGEPTRRTFIKRFGQMAGMLAVAGGGLSPSFVTGALAQAKVELEDPNSPLGKAQALALKAST
jgi:hypothetical protein